MITMINELKNDDRGVSSAVSFTIAMAIITILVTTLFIGASDMVRTQGDIAEHRAMNTLSNELAEKLTKADRLDGGVKIQSDFPREVAGDKNYKITITQEKTDLYKITATSGGTSVSTFATIESNIDTPTTVSGGKIIIKHDKSSDTLVISNG